MKTEKQSKLNLKETDPLLTTMTDSNASINESRLERRRSTADGVTSALTSADDSDSQEFDLEIDHEPEPPQHLDNPQSIEFRIAKYTACFHPLAVKIGRRPLVITLVIFSILLSLTAFFTLSPFQFVLGFIILLLLRKRDFKQLGFLVRMVFLLQLWFSF